MQNFLTNHKDKTIRQSEFGAFKEENGIKIDQYDSYFINGEANRSELLHAIKGDIKLTSADRSLQDTLSQELNFMQTMTWFGQDKYSPHFVKNINLA